MSLVGILGFQGCITPHRRMLDRIGVASAVVQTREELDRVDRLILPGGESTTMIRFLDRNDWWECLREFAAEKPVWGVCAGAILLAEEVVGPTQRSLGAIGIRARRNFYGSQRESFKASVTGKFPEPSTVEADFIRAPKLEVLPGRESDVTIKAERDGEAVCFQQGRVLASSFHTELGEDPRVHRYFLSI